MRADVDLVENLRSAAMAQFQFLMNGGYGVALCLSLCPILQLKAQEEEEEEEYSLSIIPCFNGRRLQMTTVILYQGILLICANDVAVSRG